MYNQLLLALEMSPAAGTAAAAVYDSIAADFAAIGADLHAWIGDLGAEFFSAIGLPDLLLP